MERVVESRRLATPACRIGEKLVHRVADAKARVRRVEFWLSKKGKAGKKKQRSDEKSHGWLVRLEFEIWSVECMTPNFKSQIPNCFKRYVVKCGSVRKASVRVRGLNQEYQSAARKMLRHRQSV